MGKPNLNLKILAIAIPTLLTMGASNAIAADFGKLVDAVTNTVVNEASKVINDTSSAVTSTIASNNTSSPGDTVLNTKPKAWPSKYIWWEYSTQEPNRPNVNGRLLHNRKAAKEMNVPDAFSWADLPFQHAIIRKRGNGEGRFVMFADPNCPYSLDLEQMLNDEDNVTIYMFVAPIWGGKNPERSKELTRDINCAPGGNLGRARAWERWMLEGKRPETQEDCTFNQGSKRIISDIKGFRDSYYGKPIAGSSPVTVNPKGFILPGAPYKENLRGMF